MGSVLDLKDNYHHRLSDIPTPYSVPKAAAQTYQDAILSNPLIRPDLPQDIPGAGFIRFTGSDSPSLPVNWRLTEAVSSLKALEAALASVLLKRRHGLEIAPGSVTIDTDHAALFLFSTVLWTIDPGQGGENISSTNLRQANQSLFRYFPSCDKYRMNATLHRNLATNIYKCADGRYFQVHGSLNPTPTLENIGLPAESDDAKTYEEAVGPFEQAFKHLTSEEMQKRTDATRQAGTICYSVDEYLASEHGRANAHIGLWEIHDVVNPDAQPPTWWDDPGKKGPSRPLAGLKVVDLTRIIAGPCVTRSLAELGASVMRCTASHLPDVAALHVDLNWGKWNCNIDLRDEKDRERLRDLILDADVVVQGYRPGTLDKYGFGQDDIIKLCASRARGIIAVRENCYGWYGPWKDRSGWQQVADAVCVFFPQFESIIVFLLLRALLFFPPESVINFPHLKALLYGCLLQLTCYVTQNTGLSLSFGQAMGLPDEPVTPIFPHSDYCTGIAGSCAIIIALLRRAETGGSYSIDLALNYYSTWLIRSVGTYPLHVWDKLWAECGGRPVYRHWVNNGITVPKTLGALRSGPGGAILFRDEFFEDRAAPGTLGPNKKIRCVKGVADWNGAAVRLGFNVGTRGNGVDAARWPLLPEEDLEMENIR